MKWFKHMSDASDDDFIEGLEENFGLEGYARWWKMLEIIARSMDKTGGCSATHSWVKWQSFLKGKRNKLETFLGHCQNESKITLKLTGNILEIKCPNLLKLRDEYNSRSGEDHDSNRESLRSSITDTDTDIKKEERKNTTSPVILDTAQEKSNWVVVGGRVNKIMEENGFMPVSTNIVQSWITWGVEPETDVYPVVERICREKREKGETVGSLKFFNNPIAAAMKERNEPMPEIKINGKSNHYHNQPSAHDNLISGVALWLADGGIN